ncbi:hypothetical protein PG994_008245 [Apiospora phragmitis]|uniref:Uncharacterized protein n=1 Tax=Apiospora phragmitis TaxID=2905665 RepID=A0ABR1UVL8_9PEZI
MNLYAFLYFAFSTLCLTSTPFVVCYPTMPELLVSLWTALVWAYIIELLHAILINIRTFLYWWFVDWWMQLRHDFWASIGYPIAPDVFDWNIWEPLGFPREEGPELWDTSHPAVKVPCGIIKLFQIHVERLLLWELTYWMPGVVLPAVALKFEYLPRSWRGALSMTAVPRSGCGRCHSFFHWRFS